jgi:hypothetical protein
MPPNRVRKAPAKRTADDSPTAAPKPPSKRRVTKTPKVAEAKAIAELEEKQKLLSATTLRATRMTKTPEPEAGPSNANNVLPEDLLEDDDVFGSNPKDKKGKGPARDSSAIDDEESEVVANPKIRPPVEKDWNEDPLSFPQALSNDIGPFPGDEGWVPITRKTTERRVTPGCILSGKSLPSRRRTVVNLSQTSLSVV